MDTETTLKDCSLATKEVGKECKKMPLFDPPSVGQSTLKDCSLSRLGHQGSGGGVPKKKSSF